MNPPVYRVLKPNANIGPLYSKDRICQLFQSEIDGLSSISLYGATYFKEVLSDLELTISEGGCGQIIRMSRKAQYIALDNHWITFKFDAIEQSAGKAYWFCLNIGELKSEITFLAFSDSAGFYLKNGIKHLGNLCFETNFSSGIKAKVANIDSGNEIPASNIQNEFFVPCKDLDLYIHIQKDDVTAVHHLIRYQWSLEVLKAEQELDNILDVACGSGYGSYMLARNFPETQVVGADYDPAAIRLARNSYTLPNLEYRQADVLQWERSLGEKKYDAIISFDTLEHVDHREIMLENIVDHMKMNGVLLLSTPCGSGDTILTPDWEYHKIEYSAACLFDFLSRYFDHISRPEEQGFLGGEVFSQLEGTNIHYLLKMNPVICKDPIRVVNPYKRAPTGEVVQLDGPAIGPITNRLKFVQIFVSEKARLYAVSIKFGYVPKDDSYIVSFGLASRGSNELLRSVVVNAEEIESNSWHDFTFEPIEHSMNESYSFILETKRESNGLFLMGAKSSLGGSNLDGEQLDLAACFKAYYREPIYRACYGQVAEPEVERVSHLWPNDCFLAHLAVYRFAADFVKEKQVFDAGCGMGYGAAYLSDAGARMVIGVDISAEAVQFSKKHFRRHNLEYLQVGLDDLDSQIKGKFDIIFSSNTLEHVRNIRPFLTFSANRLTEDGMLIIAVPPIIREVDWQTNIENPYHLHIWTPQQWLNVLGQYFLGVVSFRQDFTGKDVPLDFLNKPEESRIDEKDFIFTQTSFEDYIERPSLTILLVAKEPRCEEDLPSLDSEIAFIDKSFSR